MESKKIVTKEKAIRLGLKKYYTGTPCSKGHMSERYISSRSCIECLNNIQIDKAIVSIRSKNHYEKNKKEIIKRQMKRYEDKKEEIKATQKIYASKNKEKIFNRNKSYRDRDKEILKERRKIYYQENKNRIRIKNKKRRKEDKLYCLSCSVRTLVREGLKSKGLRKNTKTENILECSFEFFKEYIENQFKSGMLWDNRSEWHIDHKIPLATAKTKEDIIRLNHYTNLQPLWAIDNLKKGAKLNYVIS